MFRSRSSCSAKGNRSPELQAEKRECFDEKAAPGDDLRPPLREKVESSEFLEDTHRVRRAEHGDGARQSDAACADRGGCEEHSRRGVEDSRRWCSPIREHLEAHLVSEHDRFEQLAEMFSGSTARFATRSNVDATKLSTPICISDLVEIRGVCSAIHAPQAHPMLLSPAASSVRLPAMR